MESKDEIDGLWKLYAEHRVHLRHQELQRAAVASALLTASSIVLAFIYVNKTVDGSDWAYALGATILSIFGALFAWKHEERIAWSNQQSRDALAAIADLSKESALTRLLEKKRQQYETSLKRWIGRLKVGTLWIALHLLLGAFELAILLVSVIDALAG